MVHHIKSNKITISSVVIMWLNVEEFKELQYFTKTLYKKNNSFYSLDY